MNRARTPKKATAPRAKKGAKKASKVGATTAPEVRARALQRANQDEPIEIPLNFAAVAAAFAKDRRVTLERGWGADNVVLKLEGKIFVMFARGDLVAKLPKSRVDELVGAGQGIRFDPRRDGRLMKEWLVVSSSDPNWVEWAREAHEFVTKSQR